MSWDSVEFSELVEDGAFGPRFSSKSYADDGNIATLRTTDLSADGTISYETMPLASLDESKFSKHFLQEGDIVISRSGRIGTTAYFTGYPIPVLPGAFLLYFRFRNSANPRFYTYWFNSSVGQQRIMSIARGAAQQNINLTNTLKLRVPIVPKKVQDRVVEILSAYDDMIENNRRRIELLEQSARLLYKEWFVHLRFPGHENVTITHGIPESWTRKPLKGVTTKIGSGATPKGGQASYKEEGITLIRSQHVYDYQFDDAGLAFIDEEQAARLDNVIVESRDILLNITGASVARCCMVLDRLLPARVNQHVMIIRVDPELCSPHYILGTINSFREKQLLLNIARAGGATREALTKDTICNTEFLIPPTKFVREFHDIAEDLFNQRQALSQQNLVLAKARDLLLPRLMSGEISA